MDKDFLKQLLPSLLVFSVIAFSLLVTLPGIRMRLKREVDEKIKSPPLRTSDFFFYSFYIAITKRLYVVGLLYFIGIFFVLLCPTTDGLRIPAWAVILLSTSTFLVLIIVQAYKSVKKAILSSHVITPQDLE